MQKSQLLAEAQDKLNLSWANKPKHTNTQAYAQWEAENKALQADYDAANAALQALFQEA